MIFLENQNVFSFKLSAILEIDTFLLQVSLQLRVKVVGQKPVDFSMIFSSG